MPELRAAASSRSSPLAPSSESGIIWVWPEGPVMRMSPSVPLISQTRPIATAAGRRDNGWKPARRLRQAAHQHLVGRIHRQRRACIEGDHRLSPVGQHRRQVRRNRRARRGMPPAYGRAGSSAWWRHWRGRACRRPSPGCRWRRPSRGPGRSAWSTALRPRSRRRSACADSQSRRDARLGAHHAEHALCLARAAISSASARALLSGHSQ